MFSDLASSFEESDAWGVVIGGKIRFQRPDSDAAGGPRETRARRRVLSKMPETRRTRQRGWGLVPLGIAALTAATGAALYWYFSRDQRVPETSRRRTIPTKKKSVVIVLSQVFPCTLWMIVSDGRV